VRLPVDIQYQPHHTSSITRSKTKRSVWEKEKEKEKKEKRKKKRKKKKALRPALNSPITNQPKGGL